MITFLKKFFCLLILSALAFPQTSSAFFDDVSSSDYYYFEAVDWLEYQGIVSGYEDNTFRPDQSVNRAEFLKMLYGTLGYGKFRDFSYGQPLNSSTFSDLPDGYYWYEDYVSQAYYDGIIDGYEDGTFRPDAAINFAEAAKILANAFFDADNQPTVEYGYCLLDGQYYTDQWFYKYTTLLDKSCIFPETLVKRSGYHPGLEVTRSDMATLLYRTKTVKDHSTNLLDLENFVNLGEEPDSLMAPNEFYARGLESGDEILEWMVKEKAPSDMSDPIDDMNLSISFDADTYDGFVTLSGTFYHNEHTWTCFDLDEESEKKLPKLFIDRSEQDVCVGWPYEPGIEEIINSLEDGDKVIFETTYYEYYHTDLTHGENPATQHLKITELYPVEE